ncbi:hypothetical protein M406DRAFT_29095, partial [Cryphonectria parasitica EP155]
LHPYYPPGVVIQGYVANTLSTPAILMYFCSLCAAALSPAFFLINRRRSGLPSSELATALWFVLCGYIHIVVEGYFAFNHSTLGGDGGLMGQMWKEYSLSDSRYLTSDTFTVCMETITAVFWGPLSLLCAYYIAADHPARHPVQFIVSLGQLYGDVLYYAICTFEELVRETAYSRPDRAYFWGYYVLLNSFWIVIPSILLLQSTRETIVAF